MIAFASGISSCQEPKEEEGPPTQVLPVPPEPRPGLKCTPSWSPRAPRRSSPNARSWRREHALYLMPMARSTPGFNASFCELSEMHSGATHAAMARRTLYEEETSMWRPMRAGEGRAGADVDCVTGVGYDVGWPTSGGGAACCAAAHVNVNGRVPIGVAQACVVSVTRPRPEGEAQRQ
eukprot:3283094-Pleurochrysis_carterae.AAC.7